MRFKKKVSNFKIAAAIGYAEDEDDQPASKGTNERISGSVSVMHIPTGLNFTFAAGDDENDSSLEQSFYYAKVGLFRKWNSLGKTAISVDYGFGDEFAENNGEFTHWGIQINQYIDAAAMEVYASYSHNEYENDTAQFEDIDIFMIGSRIKF